MWMINEMAGSVFETCYNSVLWAVKNGVTTGKTTISFAPDDSCIRAQIVTFLYRDMAA